MAVSGEPVTQAEQPALPHEGRQRAVIESISPVVDGGRYAVKRVVGDRLAVEADAFVDGHDMVVAVLLHRRAADPIWSETPMTALGNDRWRATFEVTELGEYRYTVTAWADRFLTWRHDLEKRVAAGQDLDVDLRIGGELVEAAAARAAADKPSSPDAPRLAELASYLRGSADQGTRSEAALGDELGVLMARHPDRRFATTHEPELAVAVDPVKARYSTWYELFPRSASPEPGRHGTFRDVIGRLPYVADLGFDVLYLPPIHPIGRMFRKGPNNRASATPADPGVPWAIGGPEGGHTEIHPALGTLDDFRALVRAADARGISIALDLAFQASPDHPFVRDHAEWFRRRPDGSIQYAENPPKKYQDIYPFDFETEAWPELWTALLDVTRFWVGQGVRIFRVDNPHTKPFRFWDWLIGEVKRDDPDVIFLAEAFTRPKVMYRLAKGGFSQSYTYFTWRNSKQELQDYFTELGRPPVSDFFRPNVWPNTPDILHETLQHGGRAAFELRLVLAATLAATYGIYGPAYELGEHVAREPGSEEYLDSEKYQLRYWDLDRADSIGPLIRTVNRIRREHRALQSNEGLAFHEIDDDRLIAYTKATEDGSDVVLTVVNLDPHVARRGTVNLPADRFGIADAGTYEAVDLLSGTTYLWQGPRNQVFLDPAERTALILHLRPPQRSERDFEYYL
jgi:starch synthase (maltosyl-transferring)